MSRPFGNFIRTPHVRTPHSGDLPLPLTNGSKVFIRLRVNDNANDFTINLETPNGIAFHLNPRVADGLVVKNSFFGEQWGDEDRDEVMPFQENKSYGIEINADEEKYSVVVDGVPLCDFPHRVSCSEVDNLEVKGDIKIQDIIFSFGNNEPEESNSLVLGEATVNNPFDSREEREDQFSREGSDFFKAENPETPYSGEIPGGLVTGKKVFVRAKLDKKCNDFKINLEAPHGGIGLHFNARLNYDVIVMNSFFGVEWGEEVRVDKMPFKGKKTYGIEIRVESDHYSIGVDGKHLCQFAHRCPAELVNSVRVEGDLEIQDVIFTM